MGFIRAFKEGSKEGSRLFVIYFGEISNVDSLALARKRALEIYAGLLPPNQNPNLPTPANAPIAGIERSPSEVLAYSLGLHLAGPRKLSKAFNKGYETGEAETALSILEKSVNPTLAQTVTNAKSHIRPRPIRERLFFETGRLAGKLLGIPAKEQYFANPVAYQKFVASYKSWFETAKE